MRLHRSLVMIFVLGGVLGGLPSEGMAAEKSAQVFVGYGLSFIDTEEPGLDDPYGTGLFLAGEYVVHVSSWFTPRAYAGTILTWPKQESCPPGTSPCDVSSKAVFVGGKSRILLPIPYVGPFFEVGLGGTVGSVSTQFGTTYQHDHSGLAYHIPFAVGLAIGSNHQYEIAFSYLYYPSFEHMAGAFALGFELPFD